MADLMQHNGMCSHCGSSVKPGFNTCTGCGATWQAYLSEGGQMLFLTSWLLAGVCALAVFVAIYALGSGNSYHAQTPGSATVMAFITWFGATVGFVNLALRMRRFGWLR